MKLSQMHFKTEDYKPVVLKDGMDVTAEIETGNGKANPFGLSCNDLLHVQNVNGAEIKESIGYLYCGYPHGIAPGYQFFEKSPDGNLKEWK